MLFVKQPLEGRAQFAVEQQLKKSFGGDHQSHGGLSFRFDTGQQANEVVSLPSIAGRWFGDGQRR